MQFLEKEGLEPDNLAMVFNAIATVNSSLAGEIESNFEAARQATLKLAKRLRLRFWMLSVRSRLRSACFLHLRRCGGDIRKQHGNVISGGQPLMSVHSFGCKRSLERISTSLTLV
jgi:hypothetical protein